MELTVHGKQMDVGDALRTHVADKITDLNEKYFNRATYATVTFSREGHGHPRTKAHISIQVGGNIMVVADAIENDPYQSFESAASKVGKQLRRYKRKLRDHHERLEQSPEAEFLRAKSYVIAAAPEQDDEPVSEDLTDLAKGDDPLIIAEMDSRIETLSVSEAVMRMDLANKNAFMFRNAGTGKFNMVYRRPDGTIGWVDPEN